MPKGIYKNKRCFSNIIPSFSPNLHQTVVKDYFLNSTYKGLLLYHQLGSGKTCTAITTADEFLKQGLTNHIFILTPGSLRENWLHEYCYACGIGSDNLDRNYTFITYNYDISNQLANIDFNDSFVIIDEFHTVINGKKNNTKTYVSIYDKIVNSDCRVFLLSGTPIIKEPSEEWPLILKLIDANYTPETEPNTKNLVSYYETDNSFYPTIIYKDPIKVKMSDVQSYEFGKTLKFELSKISEGAPNEKLKLTDLETYKKKYIVFIKAAKLFLSRRISNFFYDDDIKDKPDILSTQSEYKYIINPDEELEIQEEIDSYFGLEKSKNIDTNFNLPKPKVKVFGWVNNETLANKMLLKNSSKFTALILNILKHRNTKHMVYSIFKIKGGVILLNTLLTKCGIKSAVFSGDLNDGKRSKLLSKFNSPENRNGELIEVIFLTEAGEQGITLLETNNVHILESSPHNYKIQQAIGRAARFKSHINLPPERNYVNVWRYWSVPTHKDGIDEILFNRAKRRQDIIDNFNTTLKSENIENI